MPDWLVPYLEPEQLAILGVGFVAFVGTVWSGITGARKGKPTSTAVAAAIEAASCRSGDLVPIILRLEGQIGDLAEELEEMKTQQQRQRDILVRIEDRTTRR